jgi:hypothetical protein
MMRTMMMLLGLVTVLAPMTADAALCRNRKSGAVAVKPVCAKKFVPATAADLGATDPDGGLSVGNAGIGIADGGVTTERLAPGAVTPDKLGVVPAARVTSSVPINIPNGGGPGTALTFDDERFDTEDLHGSVEPTRLTAPRTGIYVVSANVSWSGDSATGQREIAVVRNGSAIILRDVVNASTGGSTTEQAASTVTSLESGDYVEVKVRQNSGGGVEILSAAEFSPEFALAYIGGLP